MSEPVYTPNSHKYKEEQKRAAATEEKRVVKVAKGPVKTKKNEVRKLADIFISEDVGYEKPDIRFFEHVWAKIGAYKPNEVMIVGDSLTSDMQGGNNTGIVCCWYNPNKVSSNTNLKIDYEITDLNEILPILMIKKKKNNMNRSED